MFVDVGGGAGRARRLGLAALGDQLVPRVGRDEVPDRLPVHRHPRRVVEVDLVDLEQIDLVGGEDGELRALGGGPVLAGLGRVRLAALGEGLGLELDEALDLELEGLGVGVGGVNCEDVGQLDKGQAVGLPVAEPVDQQEQLLGVVVGDDRPEHAVVLGDRRDRIDPQHLAHAERGLDAGDLEHDLGGILADEPALDAPAVAAEDDDPLGRGLGLGLGLGWGRGWGRGLSLCVEWRGAGGAEGSEGDGAAAQESDACPSQRCHGRPSQPWGSAHIDSRFERSLSECGTGP